MIKIYHNPKCGKSREALGFLRENTSEKIQIIEYLKDEFTEKELKEVINLLGIKPFELVRTNENIWKDKFKDKFKDNIPPDEDLIKILVKNPKLIQRPIIVNGKMAVIGRPAENILTII